MTTAQTREKEKATSEQEAWRTVFFIENHLDHIAYPYQVATPEQVEFMVHTQKGERYYPCSDSMFEAIIGRKSPEFLQKKYQQARERVLALVELHIRNPQEKEYLKALLMIKFNHETRDNIMIPSRLEKRLLRIFLNTTQIEDPQVYIKEARNRRVEKIMGSAAFKEALNDIAPAAVKNMPGSLAKLQEMIECTQLSRLLNLTADSSIWLSDRPAEPSRTYFANLFSRKIQGDGLKEFMNMAGIKGKHKGLDNPPPKKFLWLANEAGEIVMDLAIIGFLTKLGHKVILCLKGKPLYTKVRYEDTQSDPVLVRCLKDAYFIEDKALSKNELVEILKRDSRILVISDGTGEDTNLLLATTTFARIFKEVDGVVSRGGAQKRRFFETRFQFTQEIFNISENEEGHIEIAYKAKHPSVIKFTLEDLEKKARAIIERMEHARRQGMSVMFYSGIIGSIPGRIDVAKKIMTTFIGDLKEQMSGTFIVNPSEYYEVGMDADDLMYMWEIVQRSGCIDIWRFQTFEDIEEAFSKLGEKVPPEWVGKDATYSTGCTKEMRIAESVLARHPEMQIIGPAIEKFMRRDQYGIGKMYDKRLAD